MRLPLSLSCYYMYVYTYISIMCVYMYCIILSKTVVTTAFCRFLRKKLRPRATSASTFPSPSLPSYFRQKIAYNVRREYQTLATSRARSSFIAHGCDAADCSFFWLFSHFFFFSPSWPKIVGRRTRVLGQGSKTWKGYRNSLFPPFLSSFLSFVAISLLFFLSVLILSLSLLLSHRPRKKKK